MKAAVIGANGQLGTDLAAALEQESYDVARITHADLEIGDPAAVRTVLGQVRPNIVINTAAMHNVEACEQEPERAYQVNSIGARALAQYCAENGVYLLHVSTDYVFDGKKKKPYVETDAPLPLNVYGNSKVAGESFVLSTGDTGAVLRVSGIYGTNKCRAKGGLNFVQLMLKLADEREEVRVVDDEILTPTNTIDIARQVVRLCDARAPGLFHGTAHGQCSWYRFAQEIFSLAGKGVRLLPARPGEFPAKVPRPSYSVLENQALKSLGLDVMSDWESGLKRYLSTR
ncbi:dTDP-4-dehydrorhamnose reductase [Reyranella sp. CPCC 100927]|uniref:dTDP-4-dehydrorhamnose reductase n=1 Tax=Reyranella sp. CPCC 100927 TaxID=2599616 RepID=UPI0011B4697B|nr:dTDP-4-dehydrorhamnose reductase [Reyranella sp. CPCC 100927]TWT12894.1 dTDP-4-dehydrorhamnose reductase [Reyranella sp. CPCC 100927]